MWRDLVTFGVKSMVRCGVHADLYLLSVTPCPAGHKELYLLSVTPCPAGHKELYLLSVTPCPAGHKELYLHTVFPWPAGHKDLNRSSSHRDLPVTWTYRSYTQSNLLDHASTLLHQASTSFTCSVSTSHRHVSCGTPLQPWYYNMARTSTSLYSGALYVAHLQTWAILPWQYRSLPASLDVPDTPSLSRCS